MATHGVTFNDLEQQINDCNLMDVDSSAFNYRTISAGASNAPTREEGMCLFIPIYSPSGTGYSNGKFGIQMFYSKNGDIYNRTYSRVNGSQSWTTWQRVDYNTEEWSKYIKKPESMNPIQNANRLLYSGVFKTSEQNPTTEGLPPNTSKWGVIQHFFENTGGDTHDETRQTGFQLYAPIDGDKAGSLFVRVKKPNITWSNTAWHELKIEKILGIQDKTWTYPDTISQDINADQDNGYHYTTEEGSRGVFPTGVSKHGFLKTMVSPAGYIKQVYTPLEGENAGQEYSRTKEGSSSASRAGATWNDWTKLSDDKGSLKIHDTRNSQVPLPSEYKQHSHNQLGYVVYEWKFTDTLNPSPSGEGGQRCILCTMEPDPKDTATGQEFDDITQIAYIIDGKTYIRHGSPNNDSWLPWKPLGGSSTPVDNFIEQLTTELQKWVTQADTASRAFEYYHKQKVIAMFNSWTQ